MRKIRRIIEELGFEVATPAKRARCWPQGRGPYEFLTGEAGDEQLRTIIDIFCHIFPDRYFQEMSKAAPNLENMGTRLKQVTKLFDLDIRFREMDQFGDYREIISLPNPPIEDIADAATRLDAGTNRQ